MKKFLPLLCALFCALPALAQDKDAPKELGFSYSFESSPDGRDVVGHITYQLSLTVGKPIPFDETIIGKNGAIQSEKISFIDKTGVVLGTLDSAFDEGGHLKSQSLTEGKSRARALHWFETDAQSPALTVSGSAVMARYIVRNGLLLQNVVNLEFPSGARALTATYDVLGHREHDTITSSKGPIETRYLYDQTSLIAMKAKSPEGDRSFEGNVLRNKDGKIAEISYKVNGVVGYRTTPLYDEQGQSSGNKMETFENGKPSVVMLIKGTSAVVESYKDGVLVSRKTIGKGEGDTTITLSDEVFDADGKTTTRTDFNIDGTASTVTTYNADGTVKSTRKFDEGQ